jgi:acetoin utilization protein AcuB
MSWSRKSKKERRAAMLVGERMTHPVITVSPDTPMQEALRLMHVENIRRLPVTGSKGKLVGIVSESDLLHASPSDASTLSVWEVNYLLSKLKLEEIMTTEVITVTEDTPIEDAARVMADNKIGGLPVVRDGEVVGIITETDLFKVFLELMGARERGVRLTALLSDVPGELAKLAERVAGLGGNIVALGTFMGETSENRLVTLKVRNIEAEALKEAVAPIVERVVDLRTSGVA